MADRLDLDALEKVLAETASPLTWWRQGHTVYARMTTDPRESEEHAVCDAFASDAALIVAAVNALPRLIALARAARTVVEARGLDISYAVATYLEPAVKEELGAARDHAR